MSYLVRVSGGLVAACFLVLGLVAAAQEEETAATEDSAAPSASFEGPVPYIGGLGIYRETDRDFVDYGAGLNFIYGTQRDEKWNHEWVASMAIHETDSAASDFYRYAFGWDALYFLDRDGIQPYLVGGLGIHHNEILKAVGGDETGVYANLGGGFVAQPFGEHNLALRGDLRVVYDDGVDEADLVAGLGLQMPLSRAQPAAAAVNQCTPDTDGDGVNDCLDKCPGTMQGLKVDETGCAVPQVFVLKGVSFDFDSTRLGVNAQTILEDAVKTMLGQPSMKVEIAGHTDNYGSDEYNQSLSQRRADSVKDHLISKGVNADNLRSAGYGESQPVASNDNDFGREQNRRVEFRIESQ
jgi:OOP family OmpA-OmpF porin